MNKSIERSVRHVVLDVANAGVDDGLPPSILREIAILKSLGCFKSAETSSPTEHLCKIIDAGIKDK
jgi:hypothetical protein